jgi:hypothetical protein
MIEKLVNNPASRLPSVEFTNPETLGFGQRVNQAKRREKYVY